MKKTVLTAIIFFLLFSPVAVLAEKLVFVGSEWPPYLFMKDEKPAGADVDMLAEACKRAGVEPEILQMPWKRALRDAKEGEVDAVFFPRKTEDRVKFLYFTPEKAYCVKVIIVARKGSGIKKTENLGDLKDKSFAVTRAYKYGPKFDNYKGALKKYECNDDKQLMKIFVKGRSELAIGEEGNLKYVARELGIQWDFETVSVVSEALSYIGFSKKANEEKGKKLSEKFGKVLKEMWDDGTTEKIMNKYF